MRVKSQMKNSKRRAFTLVELLVVIAIIGILFVVLISKVDFATDKAKATGVQTDFRSYQLAIETVARENAGLSVLVDKDAEGDAKYAALEAALNKNLDPKLHVEIDADGKISTKAKDPWKEEYLGAYLAPDEDGTVKDRGAIIMYSKGSNLKLGTDAVITNGVVETTLNDETAGKDDFKIAVIYTYLNGYGKIQTTTDGFSNDIEGDETDVDNNEPENPAEPDVPNTPDNPTDPDEPENPNTPDDPAHGEAQAPDYPAASEGLAFTLKDDDTYEVSDIGECTDTDIVIPVTYNDKLVTSIGDRAFYYCGDLTSITIPSGVMSIGSEAFLYWSTPHFITNFVVAENNTAYQTIDGIIYSKDGTVLVAYPNGKTDTSFTIPNGVTTIGMDAFGYCNNLTSVAIPDGVTTLCTGAFARCKNLTSISLPNSVITVGDLAFFYCSNLTSVTIPDSVTTIGSSAFSNCSKLASVTIPNSVTSISDHAFSNSGLKNVVFDENCQLITFGDYMFSFCESLTSINIPDSITNLGTGSFYKCTGLTSVVFGENSKLTSISKQAFSTCTSLTSINIPHGVTSIGIDAFYDCDGLISIVIPESVTSIEYRAFYESEGLTSVVFGENSELTIIGDFVFGCCSSLTNITIPDSVTSIGCDVFSDCSSLTHITIPDSVTSIDERTFLRCENLMSITISDSVTSIGDYALHSCTKLTNIIFNGTIEQWNTVSLGVEWNKDISTTEVICSDGTVTIE